MSQAILKFDLDDPEESLRHVRAVYADELVWFIQDVEEQILPGLTTSEADQWEALIEQHRIGHLF